MASSHKLVSLFLFLWSVNARDDGVEPVAHHARLLINRLYVFGDSNVDPGNTMKVVDPDTKRITKVGLTADFPPYGIDFDEKSTATGRFTNGKTAADCLGREPPANAKPSTSLDWFSLIAGSHMHINLHTHARPECLINVLIYTDIG